MADVHTTPRHVNENSKHKTRNYLRKFHVKTCIELLKTFFQFLTSSYDGIVFRVSLFCFWCNVIEKVSCICYIFHLSAFTIFNFLVATTNSIRKCYIIKLLFTCIMFVGLVHHILTRSSYRHPSIWFIPGMINYHQLIINKFNVGIHRII